MSRAQLTGGPEKGREVLHAPMQTVTESGSLNFVIKRGRRQGTRRVTAFAGISWSVRSESLNHTAKGRFVNVANRDTKHSTIASACSATNRCH